MAKRLFESGAAGRTYNLYRYDIDETGVERDGFLTLLNKVHAVIPDDRIGEYSHATRKLLASGVTRDEAKRILLGRELFSVEHFTYPMGENGLRLHYTAYTLENEYGIVEVNPGIRDEIVYDGKIYHPQDAGARWGEDEELP